ncbi:hypothetical protein F4778DRAFT_776875 [Xylariomycetidae sp. FL2044]|nr:hypothetical protein F4778DRAFT_776875 [Xylariomycetidae sp. FL2044]
MPPLKGTSVKGSIQVAIASLFKMSKFQQDTLTLGELVSMLRRLRKSALKKKKLITSTKKPLSREFREMRRCTASLHAVFSQQWSCKDTFHTHHVFNLLITPAISDTIELKAVVWNHVAADDRCASATHGEEERLQVWTELAPDQRNSPGTPMRITAVIRGLAYQPTVGETPGSGKTIGRKKASDISPSTAESHENQAGTATSASSAGEPCAMRERINIDSDSDTPAGYLEIPDSYRFAFSRLEDRALLHMFNKSRPDAPPPSQILDRPLHENISMLDQSRLALTLARATLHFWSTPWWADYWRLEDLRFDPASRSLTECIATIHVRQDLFPALPGPSAAPRTHTTSADDQEDDATGAHAGGVDLRDTQHEPALPRRRPAADRAVDDGGGFGVGKDLRNPRLQAALHDGVIRELEKMVEVLCLEEDECS